jgi:aminoglycoside phosphotransferase (APT) family kinase protein
MSRESARGYRWRLTQEARCWVESSLRDTNQLSDKLLLEEFDFFSKGLASACYTFRLGGPNVPAHLRDTRLLARIALDREQMTDERKNRLKLEIETLRSLEGCELPFSHPIVVNGVYDGDNQLIGMVCVMIPGMALDPKQHSESPAIIGRVAAAIHSIPSDKFSHLTSYSNCREHAQSSLAEFEPSILDQYAQARDAVQWLNANFPDERRPCRVVHGDLLPQNLLIDSFQPTDAVAVIDWEFAHIGDPAYDFAIVSRAARKFSGSPNGLRRALEVYNKQTGFDLAAGDVRVYEVLLLLHWLCSAHTYFEQGDRSGEGPGEYSKRLGGFLRRLETE